MGTPVANRADLVTRQVQQLQQLLSTVLPSNSFYQRKLGTNFNASEIRSLDDFKNSVPFTTKAELVADQSIHPPYGTNLTYPLENYSRFHQTSGTSGSPLRWLDTPQSWQWMVDTWKTIFTAAGIGAGDRILFAFSFGPFIGFWLAFEAAEQLGCLCIPGGGLSSEARLHLLLDNKATVLCCTPTYAIRLAQVARENNEDLSKASLKSIMVAGEPGGSIPSVRRLLEQLWPTARIFDHHGMTEVGPVTYECPAQSGLLHVHEAAYLAEIIKPQTGGAVDTGTAGELVLTTLGRFGSPLLRYRTGDLVKALAGPCNCGRLDLALDGGILGRIDDMLIVRGVNVFPSAIDEIVRRIGDIAEYRIRVKRTAALTELLIEIEPVESCKNSKSVCAELERGLLIALNLRVPVVPVSPGFLPRFEMKAKRWIVE